MIERKIMKEED